MILLKRSRIFRRRGRASQPVSSCQDFQVTASQQGEKKKREPSPDIAMLMKISRI